MRPASRASSRPTSASLCKLDVVSRPHDQRETHPSFLAFSFVRCTALHATLLFLSLLAGGVGCLQGTLLTQATSQTLRQRLSTAATLKTCWVRAFTTTLFRWFVLFALLTVWSCRRQTWSIVATTGTSFDSRLGTLCIRLLQEVLNNVSIHTPETLALDKKLNNFFLLSGATGGGSETIVGGFYEHFFPGIAPAIDKR